MTREELDWIEMVAIHAADHVRRGVPVEEAVRRGMEDYQRQLERLWSSMHAADMTGATDGDRRRARAVVEEIAGRVWARVNS